MFNPKQIIFAPTSECNLACGHCRVRRRSSRLDAAVATRFLERCSDSGIERVGFSGGEPFLAPRFLNEVSRAAVGQGLYFDRLMTNGVWFESRQELEEVLSGLYDAGFDGTFGVSADAFHDQEPERLAMFLETVFRIWRRKDCAEILSVRSADEGSWLEKLRKTAAILGGELIVRDGEPRSVEERRPRTEETPAGECLEIPIFRFPCSVSAGENGWTSTRWFKDDYCEGPGHVFFVHPDGSVAVCCGFANENASLIIGTIQEDDYATLMRRAGESPHVRLCYEKGLDARRRELETSGVRFPGKTDDPCFFCDYLFKNGRIGG